MFQTKVVEKIKTHFVFSNFFFHKFCCLWNHLGKCGRAGEDTDENI